MTLFKQILGTIAGFLLLGVLYVVSVLLAVALGYVFGMALAITPFISDWLTFGPIQKVDIPAVTAWLSVVGLMINVGGRTKVETSK